MPLMSRQNLDSFFNHTVHSSLTFMPKERALEDWNFTITCGNFCRNPSRSCR